MTFALPSILEAILNPNLKNPGKSGSARFLRGMKLGNNRGHQDKVDQLDVNHKYHEKRLTTWIEINQLQSTDVTFWTRWRKATFHERSKCRGINKKIKIKNVCFLPSAVFKALMLVGPSKVLTQINQTKHKRIKKDPKWSEANQLAILYKRGRGFELATTVNKSS